MKFFNRLRYLISLGAQAIKGVEHDYTTGSINKAIFLLSVPMIAEMIMESLFAVVDVYFVSKVSTNAVATVGLTESVLFIIYSIAVGLSMAVTAVVARRIGEKDPERAAEAAFQAIALALGLGVVLGGLGLFYAADVLRLMGGDEGLIAEGIGYTQVMYGSNLSIILLFLINAVFRGAGDPSIAMRSLWIANGINMVLDPILIFGWGPFPEMGVTGAAVATAIGRSTGVVYQLYFLFSGKSVVHIRRRHMVVKLLGIWELLKVSVGGVAQFLIESASWIFLVRIISRFGAEALAGYTIAFRVIVFTLLPSWGMANAASTLVGQNLGAKNPERAETAVWRTALLNTLFLVVVAAVFFVFSEPILSLFTSEPAVRAQGISALRIICFGYLFFAYGMVIGQAFNGAGDTKTPMWISLVVFWLIQIPLSYWLSVPLGWNSEGVFFCIALCHSLYALVAIVLFKRGRWKLVQV